MLSVQPEAILLVCSGMFLQVCSGSSPEAKRLAGACRTRPHNIHLDCRLTLSPGSVPWPPSAATCLSGLSSDYPCHVLPCRCTRTTCTLRTASSTPLRRCFMRWGLNIPTTWSSPPSTPPPRATWASMLVPPSWACLVSKLPLPRLCPEVYPLGQKRDGSSLLPLLV